MPIPAYEEFIVPILKILSDGGDHSVSEVKDLLAAEFGVTADEREIRLPSTPAVRRFDNRVLWAIQHLKIAGLVVTPSRGTYQLTGEGKKLASKPPARVDRQFLVAHYQPARDYFARTTGSSAQSQPAAVGAPMAANIGTGALSPSQTMAPPTVAPILTEGGDTPEESLEDASRELREKLISDLKHRLADCDPTAFEIIITRLLVKMGYAGSEDDILQLHGKPGDQGIDGVVQRDPLGLEQVYTQAKRWTAPVPLKPVVEFFEKVKSTGARAGVFVARSGFNVDAKTWINDPDHPEHRAAIAWIDGDRLAHLMVQYGIGVEEARTYPVYRIDENVFHPDTE